MSFAQTIAAVIVGGIVAAVPGVFLVAGARKQRAHENAMAIAQRRHSVIAEPYPIILRWMLDEMAWAERVHPFGREHIPRESLPTELEIVDIQTRMYAYASEPLKAMCDDFLHARYMFWLCVERYENEPTPPDDVITETRIIMDKSRGKMRDSLENIRKRIRDELSSVAPI